VTQAAVPVTNVVQSATAPVTQVAAPVTEGVPISV
jgi:hypothetical protein